MSLCIGDKNIARQVGYLAFRAVIGVSTATGAPGPKKTARLRASGAVGLRWQAFRLLRSSGIDRLDASDRLSRITWVMRFFETGRLSASSSPMGRDRSP